LETDLPSLISALSHPQVYPEATDNVVLIQTQMSCVFLSGEYAYKIKKPVNLGYLDYTTLEKRHYFCEQEVILNRRLCPNVYFGVERITFDGAHYAFNGAGEVVEYAVKMKRLPDERLLDRLLKQNAVSSAMLDDLADKLARFHAHAQTDDIITSYGSSAVITQNTEENFSQTGKYFGKVLPQEQFEHIRDYTRNFMRDNAALLHTRMSEQRIRDCHGDLHAQHICFCDDICIFDCIEFNERFRYCDVASEVAFLAMDLEHSGYADLSRYFLVQYVAYSKDSNIPALLNFYKCYRAYVRAKVACFKQDDPLVSAEDKQRSLEAAQSYFDLAYSYTRYRPLLVVMTGLCGSGKSTIAGALAGRCAAVHISSDVTRKRLAGIPETEHRYDEDGCGLYSADFHRKTYAAIMAQTAEALESNYSVVLDAAFLKQSEREAACEMARQKGADILLLECRLDAQLTKERLQQRLSQQTASDGRWEIYQKQLAWFEQVRHTPQNEYLLIDTSLPLGQNIRQVLNRINNQNEH